MIRPPIFNNKRFNLAMVGFSVLAFAGLFLIMFHDKSYSLIDVYSIAVCVSVSLYIAYWFKDDHKYMFGYLFGSFVALTAAFLSGPLATSPNKQYPWVLVGLLFFAIFLLIYGTIKSTKQGFGQVSSNKILILWRNILSLLLLTWGCLYLFIKHLIDKDKEWNTISDGLEVEQFMFWIVDVRYWIVFIVLVFCAVSSVYYASIRTYEEGKQAKVLKELIPRSIGQAIDLIGSFLYNLGLEIINTFMRYFQTTLSIVKELLFFTSVCIIMFLIAQCVFILAQDVNITWHSSYFMSSKSGSDLAIEFLLVFCLVSLVSFLVISINGRSISMSAESVEYHSVEAKEKLLALIEGLLSARYTKMKDCQTIIVNTLLFTFILFILLWFIWIISSIVSESIDGGFGVYSLALFLFVIIVLLIKIIRIRKKAPIERAINKS